LSQADERVEVTGYLPDLLDAYEGVGLVVAPLRRGAGLKFKVAQAVAMGFPVVGTSVALEGIDDLVGMHVADAVDTADGFAAAVLGTVRDLPVRVKDARRNARDASARLDFSQHITTQIQRYPDLLRSDA
jgi:glycosyltransferase involved in cell wall biosynthesis